MKGFYIVLVAVSLVVGVAMATDAESLGLLKRLLEAVKEVDEEKRSMSHMVYDGKAVRIYPQICVKGDAAKELCRQADEHRITIRNARNWDVIQGMSFNVAYFDKDDRGRYVAPQMEAIPVSNLKSGTFIAMACEYSRSSGVENQCNAFEFEAGKPCKSPFTCKKVKVCYGSRGPQRCGGGGANANQV